MVDDEGKPLKLFAFGNVARGVFAFGNMATGVVAVGSGVSFGVFAFGTNAVGSVLAVGVNTVAPISVGLANAGGVFAFALANAVGGFGLSSVNGGFSPVVAIVLGFVMFAISLWMKKPPPVPLSLGRDAQVLARFEGAGPGDAWVRARVHAIPGNATGLLLADGPTRMTAVASEVLVDSVERAHLHDVLAHLERATRLVPVDDDYRVAPREETTVTCIDLEPVVYPLRLRSIYRLSLVASGIGAIAAGVIGVIRG